jgi:hypothetical protein
VRIFRNEEVTGSNPVSSTHERVTLKLLAWNCSSCWSLQAGPLSKKWSPRLADERTGQFGRAALVRSLGGGSGLGSGPVVGWRRGKRDDHY